MAFPAEIEAHLPHLRRFSRALAGNQAIGDGRVVALLEAFVRQPSAITFNIPVRAALYRGLVRLWPSGEDEAHTARRQAVLLIAMEGFGFSEVAQILSLPDVELKRLIEQADREVSEVGAVKVLIIEDEPLIAMDIEVLVTELGHRMVGIARTRSEAIAMVQENNVDLVVSDIQLADGSSGLSAALEIVKIRDLPVVFITAYPERLLTGARPEPTFLITKPFEAETVKAVISQALLLRGRSGMKSKSN